MADLKATSSPERRVFFQFDARHGELNDSELLALFQRCGAVERIGTPLSPFTGKQKGFGFVWYATREPAQLAVAQLNNSAIAGHKFLVEAYDTGK